MHVVSMVFGLFWGFLCFCFGLGFYLFVVLFWVWGFFVILPVTQHIVLPTSGVNIFSFCFADASVHMLS